MRLRIAILVAAVALIGPALIAQSSIILRGIVGGLEQPVEITHAGDDRLFIVEQRGTIRVVKGGRLQLEPFLDITERVSCCGERGLLGLAFPSDHAVTGHLFVNYTNRQGNTVVARYSLASGEPDLADASSEQVVLTVTQPFSNHNGGQLRFGPDGMLWIGLGDGGSAGDPLNSGQRLDTLLGKILRIDVSVLPYTVPLDNPFLGRAHTRPEIWSYGWRNPWRFSFDRETGDLFVGDVGQSQWEEIDLEPAGSEGGGNYGWRIMEGAHCFQPSTGCDQQGLILPILEYSHSFGCSVTAGFRYRGADLPELHGAYLYGDFCSGRIWAARQSDSGWSTQLLEHTSLTISAFGEDRDGELYVADYGDGVIYRFDRERSRRRAVRRP